MAWSIFNRANGGGEPDRFRTLAEVVVSAEEYYDPFRVAPARRYWRVQAINSHIVNSMGAAELTADRDDGAADALAIFGASSPHLLPQWAADLQIDSNCFGVLEQARDGSLERPGLVRYVAPQAVTVMIWRDQLVGYELTPKFHGVQAYTTEPVVERPYTGGPKQFLPSEVIHIKAGLDPRYGELMGDNKLRDILEVIRIDAELTHYTLDIVRNVATNSFILMPGVGDNVNLGAEDQQSVLERMRRALTRVARGGVALMPNRVEAIEIGKNPRDLQFSDLHKDTESAIASTFNVQPILLKWRLGQEHATYSNVQQARQDEQETLIYPLAKVMERGINDFFARRGATGEVQIQVPKLWTLEQLIALDEAGLYEAAAEVADALGLPYNSPTLEPGGGGAPRSLPPPPTERPLDD